MRGEYAEGIVTPESNLFMNYVLSPEGKRQLRKAEERQRKEEKTLREKKGQEGKRKTQH